MARNGIPADRLKRRIQVAFAEADQLSSLQYRSAASASVIPPEAPRVRRGIITGLLMTTAMVALQTASQLVNFGVFDLRLQALNCDYHLSVFGVASLLAQAVAGATMVWRGSRPGRRQWAWRVLGALVVGLVLMRGLTSFNAAALAAPLACVFVLLCWLTWRDPSTVRSVVWAALTLMMTSLLLHKVGLAADTSTASDYTWAYQITGAVKHGCELAGWMLLATGVIAGIGDPRAA